MRILDTVFEFPRSPLFPARNHSEVGPIEAAGVLAGRPLSPVMQLELVKAERDEAVSAVQDWAAETRDGRPLGDAHNKMCRQMGRYLHALRELPRGRGE